MEVNEESVVPFFGSQTLILLEFQRLHVGSLEKFIFNQFKKNTEITYKLLKNRVCSGGHYNTNILRLRDVQQIKES